MIGELKNYISASSDEFADNQAIRSLTLRNLRYDKKNYALFTFKNAGTFKLPWLANVSLDSTPRLDAMTYLKKIGVPTDTTTIGMTFDKITNKWIDGALTFEGYSTRKLPANIKGVTELLADNGSVGMRTGYFINKGKSYAVLQLLTFSTRNLKVGDGTPLPFLDAIRNFIAEIKDAELPLIFDLRVNGGGNGNIPGAVLSILANENAKYAGGTSGLRMTHYARQLQEPSLFQQIPGENLSEGLGIDEFQEMLSNTLEQRLEYSPMFNVQGPIATDAKIKGFNAKIVALVTADCISACDMMSFLLKSSKRATIIGTHSNGTGAGFRSTEELNTQWEDRLRVFSSTIPNFLFGFPGQSMDVRIFEEGSASKLCSENIPTTADIPYSSTILDLARSNLGWYLKAAEALETSN